MGCRKIINRGKNSVFYDFLLKKVLSIDKFYEIVTGEKEAVKQLVEVLPRVIDNVLGDIKQQGLENSVFKELKEVDENILKSLYLLSFQKYEGFDNLSIQNIC